MAVLKVNIDRLTQSMHTMFALKELMIKKVGKLNSVKLHLIQHLPDWIRMYGSPLGFDTERWETFLSHSAKRMWKRSKKTRSDFTEKMIDKLMDCRDEMSDSTLEKATKEGIDCYIPVLSRADVASANTYSFRELHKNPNIQLTCRENFAVIGTGTHVMGTDCDWPLTKYLSEDEFAASIEQYDTVNYTDPKRTFNAMVGLQMQMVFIGAVTAVENTSSTRQMKLYSSMYQTDVSST